MVTDRFWAKVDMSDGLDACWPWTAYRNKQGYGHYFLNNPRRLVLAHRHAFELAHGPLPDGLHVCHHCDNPSCCNPLHLFPGEHYDNMMDRAAKRRGGERLSEDDALEIRRLYNETGHTFTSIAALYGVARSTITRAYDGKTWRNSATLPP